MKNLCKNGIWLVLILALAVATAQAGDNRGLIHKTLRVGMNMATYSGEDRTLFDIDPASKWGINAGWAMTYAVSRKIAFQPELKYTIKGAKYQAETNNMSTSLHYIEVPFLFKIRSETSSRIKPSIFAGPAIAFKVNSSTSYGYSDLTLATSETDTTFAVAAAGTTEDNSKSIDFGMVFGLDFYAPSDRIIIDARYELGLSKLDDSDAKADIKNSNLAISIGYVF